VTLSGTNEFAAGFGDYISGGVNGRWQSWSSTPYILSGTTVVCDFSQYSSYLVELIASTATTILISNVPLGVPVRIVSLQPSGGTGTVIWSGPTLRWSGGTVGAPTATSGVGDVFVFYCPDPGVIAAGTAMPNF